MLLQTSARYTGGSGPVAEAPGRISWAQSPEPQHTSVHIRLLEFFMLRKHLPWLTAQLPLSAAGQGYSDSWARVCFYIPPHTVTGVA